MREIASPSDFAAMLKTERAAVFLFFEWSGSAILSRRIIEQWERELSAHPGEHDFCIYLLAPDNHPFTWKWINEAFGQSSNAEHGKGSVIFLENGSVAGVVQNAARAGMKGLARVANESFLLAKHSNDVGPILDPEWLKILCCPETHQALALAGDPLVKQLNNEIGRGEVRNRAGDIVVEKMTAGLVRTDGKYLYPVRGNIPVMLLDEAIQLD